MAKLNPRSIILFFFGFLLRLGIVPVAFGIYILSLIPEDGQVSDALYSTIVAASIVNVIAWILLSLLWAWLSYRSYGYNLENGFFVKKSGVLHKKEITIPYENIQDIEIDRGIINRTLGLATIFIETAKPAKKKEEPHLIGLTKEAAEQLQNELLSRAGKNKDDQPSSPTPAAENTENQSKPF